MAAIQFTSSSPEQTEALAAKLAPSFNSGDLILLTGTLGAGKTLFVRALAAALGNTRIGVASPTYSLVHEYPGDVPLFHFDLYRIQSLDELAEAGWDDYLDRKGIIVVEWGEKLAGRLPRRYYQLSFQRTGDESRTLDLSLIVDGATT